MPGENLFKLFVKFMMVFITTVVVTSELINMASPLSKFASHSTIDEALGDKVVSAESDEAFFTLKGEDKNKNGIRDDVERVIDFQYNYKNGKIDYYDNPRDHDYYEGRIRFIMKKMQSLTRYEDVADLELEDLDKITSGKRKKMRRHVAFYQDLNNVITYSNCLYKELNAQDSVGTGAEYLQIVRTQLNTKKRREYFGEEMLLQANNIFESTIAHPPSSAYSHYGSSAIANRLKINLNFRKDCSMKEF